MKKKKNNMVTQRKKKKINWVTRKNFLKKNFQNFIF